jgi:hypothetical protein
MMNAPRDRIVDAILTADADADVPNWRSPQATKLIGSPKEVLAAVDEFADKHPGTTFWATMRAVEDIIDEPCHGTSMTLPVTRWQPVVPEALREWAAGRECDPMATERASPP